MGKGDRKTRKGKTFRKSFGVTRPHGKKGSGYVAPPKEESVEEKPKAAAKPKKKAAPKKKPAAKKAAPKKED